ncbi:MAG: SDR family oxidoreductase [Bacteroidota bacterium]
MKKYEGKVVLITGSSMGIGKAMAYHFGREGADVVINARTQSKLESTEKELLESGISVLSYAADVSNWEEVQAMVQATLDKFGRLDILINNAGIATRGSVEGMAAEVFDKVLRVNVLGSIYPAKASLAAIKQTKGSIVFISSIASLHGLPYNSIYSSSKKALTAFSESLRIETKEAGVHVGLAYVGFTENDPQKIILDANGERIYLKNRRGIKKQTPEEVAAIIERLIHRRKKTVTLSLMGKALKFFHKILPIIPEMIYTRNLPTIKAQSEGEAQKVNS